MLAMALKPFGERSLVRLMKLPAALLTRPVRGPSSKTRVIMFSTASGNRMSHSIGVTRVLCVSASSRAVSATTAPRRPQMYTSAPSLAYSSAISRPSPVPPPVTRMRLPSSRSARKIVMPFSLDPSLCAATGSGGSLACPARCRSRGRHLRVDLFLWGGQHAVAVSALRRRHLFLHDIPMLGDLAIGDAEDIHSHHRFRSPSDIAAVNGDIVALRHNETWLIPEVSRKVSQERLDCRGAVRNPRVVLLIVIAEQAVENGGITIDENSLDPRQNQCLARIHVSSLCVRRGGVPALDQTDRSASNIQTCLVVSTMAKKSLAPRRRSARERLLAAADELFYGAGINTVGIDRVIEHAGVAKASLYDCFGSKEGLIRAYLTARHEARQKRLQERLAHYDNPRDRLLGVFDVMAEVAVESNFGGCAFIRASAEARAGSGVKSVCNESRSWIRALFTDLAREAGAADPERLAAQLVLLYDGASVSAQMDHDASAAASARAAAALMLDAAIAGSSLSAPAESAS